MTAVVGVLCSDGVVIGTDSSTTFTAGAVRTIEQLSDKLEVVADRVVIAGTGQVGLGQRFTHIVDLAWREKIFNGHHVDVARELSKRGMIDFGETKTEKGAYGCLVAFPLGDNAHLCEFAVNDFQPEFKIAERIWYCSMGSAQNITDPFLGFMREVFWKDGTPSVKEAVFATVWTLDHAIELNVGGVAGPARIAILERSGKKGQFGARLLQEGELQEHRQAVESAKDRMRSIMDELRPGADDTPEIPKP